MLLEAPGSPGAVGREATGSAAGSPTESAARPQAGPSPERSDVLGRYHLLGEHLDRMAASARELGLAFDRAEAEARLAELARVTAQAAVVRLDLSAKGELSVTVRPVPEKPAGPVALMASPFRTDPGDLLLAHKTTSRHFYDQEWRRAQACGCQEALFFNYLGQVTEGAITNVFVRSNGAWATPPITDGLLPGIWRAGFLRETNAVERSLSLDDLLRADEIVIGNSVRGAMRVDTLVLNMLEGLV